MADKISVEPVGFEDQNGVVGHEQSGAVRLPARIYGRRLKTTGIPVDRDFAIVPAGSIPDPNAPRLAC